MEKMTVQQFSEWLKTQDQTAVVQVLVERIDPHNPSACFTCWEIFDPGFHSNIVHAQKNVGNLKWLELGTQIYS
jgi:hypothetical protein